MDIPFARAGMSASGLNTGWFSQLSEAAFMTDFFSSPVGMALLAGCCTWAFTAFGAGMGDGNPFIKNVISAMI